MKHINNNDIQELLTEATKFCDGIDKYVEMLQLDKTEVGMLQNEVKLLQYVIKQRDSFTENFIAYNSICTRGHLTTLIVACTASSNFTKEIGKDLGIEFPLSNMVGLKADMNLAWSSNPVDFRTMLSESKKSKTAVV